MFYRFIQLLTVIPAFTQAASLWFQPLDQEVNLGDIAKVNLEVRGPLNQQAFPHLDFYIDVIGAWNLQFGFNTEILSFRSVEYNTTPFGDPAASESLVSTTHPQAGRLDLSVTSFLLPGDLFDRQKGKGFYTLATVEFDTLKAGRSGLFWNPGVNRLSDAFGSGLVFVAERDNVDGSITVNAPGQIPEPSSLTSAALGIAAILLMMLVRLQACTNGNLSPQNFSTSGRASGENPVERNV